MKQQEQAAEPSLKQSCKFQSDMNYTQIMQVTERVCKCKTQRRALVVYKKAACFSCCMSQGAVQHMATAAQHCQPSETS